MNGLEAMLAFQTMTHSCYFENAKFDAKGDCSTLDSMMQAVNRQTHPHPHADTKVHTHTHTQTQRCINTPTQPSALLHSPIVG